jgi:hypothetical protein
MTMNFVHKVSLSHSLICHKILEHGTTGFTSPPKEVVLQIFIALKNPSSLAGLEPANLGSNGKHCKPLDHQEWLSILLYEVLPKVSRLLLVLHPLVMVRNFADRW